MRIFKGFTLLSCVVFLAAAGLTFSVNAQSATSSLSGSSRVTIPGSEVTMELPNVYQYDEGQEAWVYAGASSGISVQVLKTTGFETLSRAVTKEKLEKQQMKFLSSEELSTGSGLKARLFQMSMTVQSPSEEKAVDFIRMVFICGNDQMSTMVTANFPKVTESLLQEPLRTSLLSINF